MKLINCFLNRGTKDEVGGVVLIQTTERAFAIPTATSTVLGGPPVIAKEDVGEKYTRGNKVAQTLNVEEPPKHVSPSHRGLVLLGPKVASPSVDEKLLRVNGEDFTPIMTKPHERGGEEAIEGTLKFLTSDALGLTKRNFAPFSRFLREVTQHLTRVNTPLEDEDLLGFKQMYKRGTSVLVSARKVNPT